MEISDENIDLSLNNKKLSTDIEIHKSQRNFSINPRRTVLALKEEYLTDIIYIKPKIEGSDIELAWKLISNNFKKEGSLKLKINTYLIPKKVQAYVEFRQHVRVEKAIVDYIEEIE